MRLIREEKDFIRDAILLMLPMILQNFVTFSMSMADTFMVGVLGETALAAVTMANSPFYVMQLMIFGVQSGMSVLVRSITAAAIRRPSTASWASRCLFPRRSRACSP